MTSIEYGQNTTAGLGKFARVELSYDRAPVCAGVPAGSQSDYRTGTKIVTGANTLTQVAAKAIDPSTQAVLHTRQITLAYDSAALSCSTTHAPLRLLTSIQESAWGVAMPRVDLPAVTFAYGDLTTTLATAATASTPWSAGMDPHNHPNISWGYRFEDDRWPTVEAMLVDIDGDGLVDRLVNASTASECQASWQRNKGIISSSGRPEFETTLRPITFGSGGVASYSLPRLKWQGSGTTVTVHGAPAAGTGQPNYEGCALNGQVTAYTNSAMEFGTCHNDTQCAQGSDPNGGMFCYPGGTECTPGDGGGPHNAPFRTYLAYRWLDADGDGLTDLVAAVHGDIDRYDIELGNNSYLCDGSACVSDGEPSMYGIPGFGQWPACPGQADRCEDLTDCLDKQPSCSGSNECTTNWSSVNSCLNGNGALSPTVPCGRLAMSPGPSGGDANPPMVTRAPYQRCEGLYPWLIYKNQGNGTFASAPTIKYQPVPLESDTGDSNLTGPIVTAQNHGVMDIDGDGILDAVIKPDPWQNGGPAWQVWFGDGSGGFLPTRHILVTRPVGSNYISGIGVPTTTGDRGDQGTLDVNGDGAPDHWLEDPITHSSNVSFLKGTSFELFSSAMTGATNTSASSLPRPITLGADTSYTITDYVDGAPETLKTATEGYASSLSRTVDADNDGRVDVVEADGTGAKVFFNAGGNFIATGQSYAGTPFLSGRKAHMTSDGPYTDDPRQWALESDLVDLDGNGIPEAIDFTTGGYQRAVEQATISSNPPRLLKSINNGRGGVTTISYSSMHNIGGVTQAPELKWWDGRPKASPRTGWVVTNVTMADPWASTATSTSYHYDYPRFAPDDEGHYGFRGFEEVKLNSGGVVTVERYGYDVDWSGRRIATIVYPVEGYVGGLPSRVHTVDRTRWEPRTLFASDSFPEATLTTYHAVETEHIVCKPGQTEATCTQLLPSSPAAYTKTVSTFTALNDTTHTTLPLLWQETTSRLQTNVTPGTGDRQTTTTFALFADGNNYRLRTTDTARSEDTAGTLNLFARSSKTWDPAYLTQLTNEVWIDSSPANTLVTKFEYFPTGNLKYKWKPKQNAAGGPKTAYTYDSRMLFLASETNELGHLRTFTWEYGTGTKVQTDGPNTRTCTTGCPTGSLYPVKEQNKLVIDGLGRTLERWASFSDDGASYTLTQVETNTYTEGSSSWKGSISTKKRIDDLSVATPQWSQEVTSLDAHGRPVQVTSVTGFSPNAITTYKYANNGTLISASLPDPTSNSTATVTYAYGYDSLRRATSIRRPDATTPADRSGVDITYDGMTQTTTEVVKANDGLPASTKIFKDAFGRLVRVDEKSDATTWQTTLYAYGPDDLVRRVTDPQGVQTALTHDWAGRRTMITRAGGISDPACSQLVGTSACRSWNYAYDLNGNEIKEAVPGGTSAFDINYTTFTMYDDLDRPTEKLIAPRALGPDDLAAFGSHEQFVWDLGGNGIGQLTAWANLNPAGASVDGSFNFANAQGLPYQTYKGFSTAGYSLMPYVFESWSPLGTRTLFKHGERLGPNKAETWTRTNLDARGLPKSLEIINRLNTPGTQTSSVIGEQTRNVAGLVTERRSNVSTSMAYVLSKWQYDFLGRVVDQDVLMGPSSTRVARQHLEYFGNDDPKTLLQVISGVPDRTLTFGYDHRHQLTNADADVLTYLHSSYGYGAAGRLASAKVEQTPAPLGSEVWPRYVNYVYGGGDPEQVTALVDAGTASMVASFTYDDAGNERTRTVAATGETLEYLYDGKDQLRRVSRKLAGVVQGVEEYWYDENGARTQVLKKTAAGLKTELVFFLKDSEFHYDPSGTLTKTYAHASMGTPVARIERQSATADTPTTEFQFHGLASNTIAAVSSTGTVNASFRYGPFGEVLEATNAGGGAAGTSVHKRRFNDKYQDDISGLTYYGFRYYDKMSITWTQSDPLYRFAPDAAWTEPRRLNLYALSLNNPLRYDDPDGRDPRTLKVEYRDFSGGGDDTAQARALVKTAIGGLPQGRVARAAAKANVAIGKPTERTDSKRRTDSKTITFTMVDSRNKGSLDKAEKVADFKQERKSIDENPGLYRGVSNRDGDAMVALDVVQRDLDHIELSHFFDPKLPAMQQKYVENVVEHEGGHDVGATDTPGNGSLMDPAAIDADDPEADPQVDTQKSEPQIVDELNDKFRD